MIAYLFLVLLLIVIIVLLIVGLFIKPAMDRKKKYQEEDYYDDEYDDENGNENDLVEELEIEEEELPSTICHHRKQPAEDVSLSKSSTGQFLFKIKSSSTYPELFPVSEGSEIVLKVSSEGILVDHYLPHE